jgi:phenylpyruvate tautomerase
MPFLNLQTNVSVSKEQSAELLQQFSTLLAQATGKPERYVMVTLRGDQVMLFGGSSEPLAYLECKSIDLTSAQAKAISAAVTEVLKIQLKLSAERIYIEFSPCAPEFWGWNGGTFG